MRNLFRVMLTASLVCYALDAVAGTATCSFGWYRNAAQTDFQVPIALEEGVNGFTYSDAAADGADLCVTDAGGTQLPVEIENWNPSGKSVVWVKVPSFSKTTVLTLLWGADAAGFTPLRDNIWSDARLVMHLVNGKDSSTYNAAFVRGGDDATEDGPVGTANTFGTEARKYNCASMQNGQVANLGNNFTISFWLNSANLGKNASGTAVSEYLFVGMVPNGQFAVLHGYRAGYLELYFDGYFTGTNPRSSSPIPILDDGWHHYAWTYDGTTLKSYCDGKIVASREVSFTLKTSTSSHVFRLGGAGSSAYLHGSLDELRIESVTRPTAWLAAACETQGQTLPLESVALDLPELSVEETLTNFTALVAINNAHAAWSTAFYNAAQDGKLVFRTSPGGPDCEYEAERVPFANDLPMSWWVKLPEWRAGQKLYACWPRYAVNIPHAYVNTNAWDHSYLHVFHFTPLVERKDSIGYVTRLNGYENGAVHPTLGPYKSHYNSTADGPTGQSLAMLTTSNVFTRVNFKVVPPPITNRFTVAFWARRDNFAAPQLAYMLVYLPESGGQTALITDYGKNSFRLFDSFGYTPDGMLLPIPDAGWHHYAFTCDGSQTKGYRDGELVVTSSSAFSFNLPTNGALSAWVGGARSGDNGFVGAIDEFRVAYEPRSPEWIRACYRNQHAFRHATERLHPPAFAREVSATAGADSLAFNADLVCRLPSDVTFCWGPSDGGTTLSAWAHTRALGSCDDGALAEAVAELAADQRVCARYFATNAYGKAWSRPIWGRTPFATSAYYATVRFPGYEGRSALTNFPACVRLPASTKLPASADGVRFSAADGTPLPFEVETWNPSGESVVWVRVPVLTAATELAIAWQGLDATGDLSAGGTVWGDEYMRVYHFASANESSIYQANASASAFANYSTAESPAGTGRAFTNQSALGLEGKRFFDFAGGMTLQLWARLADDTRAYVASAIGRQQLAFIYGYVDEEAKTMVLYSNSARPAPEDVNAVRGYSRLSPPDDGWHHYAYTFDGRRFASYLDGVQVTNVEFRAAFGVSRNNDSDENRETTMNVYFGAAPSGSTKVADGALDEYRAEKVGRSADWIRACWKNQATRTFCTVGPVCGRGLSIIIR